MFIFIRHFHSKNENVQRERKNGCCRDNPIEQQLPVLQSSKNSAVGYDAVCAQILIVLIKPMKCSRSTIMSPIGAAFVILLSKGERVECRSVQKTT
jgi:hypothetical protein